MPALKTFYAKDAVTIRDDGLRVMRNGLKRAGVANPAVGPGTDYFIFWTALGNELAVVSANAIIKCDAMMEDTAEDEDLERIAALYEKVKEPAGGSVGFIDITVSQPSPIATGQQLTDALGLRYEVTIGGVYDGTDPVPIQAVDTGAQTNLPAGSILQWASAPPYSDSKAVVSTGGLINGIDAEDNEVLRERVLDLERTPPGAGNWEHFVETAEKSDPRVSKAFCHPAALGPATVRVVVVAAPTATNKDRNVDATVVSSIVDPYVQGQMPKNMHIGVTTVTNVPVDVAFALALPEAKTASPPGAGGGWLNGTPWPRPDGITTWRCTVTAVTNSTQFTVDAQSPPQVGVSRVAWVSPTTWKLYTALVTAVSGTAGAYVVTLDTPFVGVAIGGYIFPEAQNTQAYVDSVLAQFALMGPGELSSNPSVLIRGFRHPTPATSWPYTLGPHLLNRITDDNDEAESALFYHRTDGTTTVTGTGGSVTPQVPATASLAPNIYRPRNIAFYRVA